jgi:hypothetical protein
VSYARLHKEKHILLSVGLRDFVAMLDYSLKLRFVKLHNYVRQSSLLEVYPIFKYIRHFENLVY